MCAMKWPLLGHTAAVGQCARTDLAWTEADGQLWRNGISVTFLGSVKSSKWRPPGCTSLLYNTRRHHKHQPLGRWSELYLSFGTEEYDFTKEKWVSTTEGITALCEGLKGSAVTSLT